MNKKVVNKVIKGLGVLALIGMVYLGVNAFKGADEVKVSPEVETAAEQALLVALEKGVAESKLVDMVWFPVKTDHLYTGNANSNFQLDNGELTPGSNPFSCGGEDFNCAIGFPASLCEENGDGTYSLINPTQAGGLVDNFDL